MIRNGVWAGAPSGTYQAISAPARLTKQPPVAPDQSSVPRSSRNPAFSRRWAALATTWYGEGLAAMKESRSSVWLRWGPESYGVRLSGVRQ